MSVQHIVLVKGKLTIWLQIQISILEDFKSEVLSFNAQVKRFESWEQSFKSGVLREMHSANLKT